MLTTLGHTFILSNMFIWNFRLPIDNRISQTQHIPLIYGFSPEHIWPLVEKKLRYPLPRQMFRARSCVTLKMNKNENIGKNEFNMTMNLAKT